MLKEQALFGRKAIGLMTIVCLLYRTGMAQPAMMTLNSSNPEIVWKVKARADVKEAGEKIDQPGDPDKDWVRARVPGTVLASYVEAGLEKDPNFGDHIYKVERSKYDRDFWYRTEFIVPAGFGKEKVWLNCKGVNRKAELYLNGSRLGSLEGFMQRGQFDITALLKKDGKNVLTILVSWPRTPLANFSSPTYLPSAGWDWMPYVPGLNMGITDDIYLSNTGALLIHDPWVHASLPTNARADLSVAVEVSNPSDKPLQGMLKGVIQPGNIEFFQKIFIGAHSSADVKWDPQRYPQLMIHSPRLWWPNGYGKPELYTCQFILSSGEEVSDTRKVSFGIRKYTYDTLDHVLHVSINGTKVFLKGGNWGMPEYMLRCGGEEYDTKVRLHREMNFNIIRNWTGATTDEAFYEACDKYGIMVWDDFWLNANPNLPVDLNVFNANVIEKIKKLRNHPSIAVWCAENEGWPEPPLSGWLKEDLRTFDGDERWYQPNSHAENLTGSGPWANFDPRYYFSAYPTGLGGNKGWGLRTELGTAVFTNAESFKKFMPKENWWPRNEMWNLHFFGPLAFNAGPDNYDESIRQRYGQPTGIEDYCRKAQLLNIETNKAMFEGWQDHIWEDASGIMTWMSQSAYPSLVWQTYDYYYDLTGAFWGAKKACEPLHIQWNPMTNAVKIVNTSGQDAPGLSAEAAIYNLNGELAPAYSASAKIDAPANTAVQCFTIPFNRIRNNLALNKPVTASSTTYGEPALVTDGKEDTRWSSASGDGEWIYVDLGAEKEVNGVGLVWEDAYAKAFKIQVSPDARSWRDVVTGREGAPGRMQLDFPEERARYVRMQGVERGTYWGYSLRSFEVYEGNTGSEGLSDVHFIKLQLKDGNGRSVSDNFYWRGHHRKDFTALNSLPAVNPDLTYKSRRADGKVYINALVSIPASARAIAFGIRLQPIRASDGEQILPAIMSDNYFSLLPGEKREITIEFSEALLRKASYQLKAESYNPGSKVVIK